MLNPQAHVPPLQTGCFHRCLSVHRGGSLLPLHTGQTPPWADTPLSADTPLADTPWADTPPGQTPLGRHPPAQCMLGYTHLPAQCMLGYTPLPVQCMLGYTPPCAVPAGIWSTSWHYASHWNAFSGGSKRGCEGCMPPPPRTSKFFQFHAVFLEILAKSYVGAPQGVGAPSSGKSWIHHWHSCYLVYFSVFSVNGKSLF